MKMLENNTRLKNIIFIGTFLGAVVTIYNATAFFTNKIDSYAKQVIKKNFLQEKEHYELEVKETIGSEPVKRFIHNSAWIDSIKAVYPLINVKYRVMGMYINKETKHRYYIDKNGIKFKVFKDNNGNFYYFDSKINFINP